MQFFKSCLTIIWGLLFGFIAYCSFFPHYENAKRFANMAPLEVAADILNKEHARFDAELQKFQESVRRHQANPGSESVSTPPKPMRWQAVDDPELIQAAEKAITRSNEISRMSSFSVTLRQWEIGLLGFFYGTISYVAWCFLIVITTKPLRAALDTILGNFIRFVVMPFIWTALTGTILWAGFGPLFQEIVLPSPLGQLGL